MTRLVVVVLLSTLVTAGCKKSRDAATVDAAAAPAVTPDAGAGARVTLPWIEDDYAAALAKAKETGKPVLIDFWAPWCHTCLSMKSFVFVDPSLAPLADRFVWLAVNTEKPEAAALLERFPVNVWPTLYVVSPTDETAHGRWLGAASAEQLRAFLADGELSVQAGRGSPLPGEHPLRLLLSAQQASMAQDYVTAAIRFERALTVAPADWPRRPDALVGRIEALYRAGKTADCANLGLEQLDATGKSASASDFIYFTFNCLDDAKLDETGRKDVLGKLETRLATLVADASAPLSADDRGDAYGLLIEIRKARGDEAGAQAAAEERLAMLEAAAAAAPDAQAASTFAWARADTYLTLGRPEEAVAMLNDLAAKLPEDYSIPHWLARVHLKTGKHAEALAAADRALALAYGPRKGRIHELKADIHAAAGRPKEACAELRAQGELYASLPDAQLSKKSRESHAKRLATDCPAEDVENVGRLHAGED